MMESEQRLEGCNRGRHRTGLWRDSWFWLALALGPLASWVLLEWFGGGAAAGLQLVQWRQLLWLILLYPVVEEFLFRGLLQRTLCRYAFGAVSWLGFSRANLIASLLFAVAHLAGQGSLWALLVIPPSLLFGWFRDRYDSILPGTILHCSYNLAFFAIIGL